MLVNGIFIPTIELLSDPDYLNQYIAWLVSTFVCWGVDENIFKISNFGIIYILLTWYDMHAINIYCIIVSYYHCQSVVQCSIKN